MIHLYARVSTDKQENGREALASRLMVRRDDAYLKPHVDQQGSTQEALLTRPPEKL